MISTKDIYYKVGKVTIENGFLDKNVKDKKLIVIEEIKKYIISKLTELGVTNKILKEKFSIMDLFEILYNTIPKEEHSEVLSHIVHCILNIAGTMQRYEIVWWQEKSEQFINNSIAEFNEDGTWDCIKTHEETNYCKVFDFVYDVFINRFMEIPYIKRKQDIK